MNLFNKKILNQRIASYSFPKGEKAELISKLITGWQKSLKDSDLSKTKERSVQGKFLNVFFEQILGYEDKTGGKEQWTLIAEPKTEVDAQSADGSIGFFSKDINTTVGVIELKDAKTSLDKKQSGREKGYSPIEQAYLYATKFDRCKWIIVSNFREIRLYNKSRSEQFYEKFDILELHKEDEFKKFYYLLNIESLISTNGESSIDDLAKKSEDNEEDISKKFYLDYKNGRDKLFKHLAEFNPEIDKKSLFEKSQKILDRVVFILFCEDTANLLPKSILKDTYNLGIKSRDRSDQRVWREMKNLFIDIDEGRNDIDPKINGYNGGLFKSDDVLDNLVIKDDIWQSLIKLTDYDFETDLNVNILGHIFEQSIGDIESIKSEIEGLEVEKKKTKRKKDGIFYTPEYITKYIVESSVGRYLSEHPEKLETIKILDPACGSGSMLNQAHSYLLNEYKVRHEQHILAKEEKGEAITLFDYNPAEANRAILLNNLYGVDLNDESAEITKLSLWLKTARKDEPLQNLDGNIKVGNSLISDSEFAGDKAFNWKINFKEVIDEGGFDVIIGNPPYVRSEIISKDSKYYEKSYSTYHGKNDLYVYFFEKSLELLKEGGYLAFIVSSKFTKTNYGKILRQYILNNAEIVEFIDFNDLDIFEGITAYPAIIVLKKTKTPSGIIGYKNIKILPNNASEILNEKTDNFEQSKQGEKEWLFLGTRIKDLIESKTGLKAFNQILSTPNVGIKTGYNDAFLITEDQFMKLNSYEQTFYKKYLTGKDIHPYKLSVSNYVFFPYKSNSGVLELRTEDEIKDALKLLESEKENLSKRAIIKEGLENGTKVWYEFQQINKLFNLESEYIVYPNVSNGSSFMISKGNLVDMTGFFIPIRDAKDKAYLPILNSRLINAYHKVIAIERRGGYRENKTQYIIQTLLPDLTEEQIEKFNSWLESRIEVENKYNRYFEDLASLLLGEYGLATTHKILVKELSGWNEFIESFEKQKISLSLDRKDELQQWFRKKQLELTLIQNEIEKIDDSINAEVYRLYNLSESEIDIIQRSSGGS